jgi:hypothetical protein
MSKPWIHAESSAKRFGGKPEDYISIHNLMDSSKGTIADSRHRALTHNAWFIGPDGPLERIFGVTMTNSDGRVISVREIGEQHVLEDFGNRFIPSAQDYLQEINIQEWMLQGKGAPPSFALIYNKTRAAVAKKISSWKTKVEDTFLDGVQRDIPPEDLEDVVEEAQKTAEETRFPTKRNPYLID